MTEREFQDQYLQLARACGWQRICHFRPARTMKGWRTPIQGDKGFPDTVICGQFKIPLLSREPIGKLIFAELKVEQGELTVPQHVWIDLLRAAGQEVYVWRPSDWSIIERTLDVERRLVCR